MGHFEDLSTGRRVVRSTCLRHNHEDEFTGSHGGALREHHAELVVASCGVVILVARNVRGQIARVQQFHELVIEVVPLAGAGVVVNLVDDDAGQRVVARGVVLKRRVLIVVQCRGVRATRDDARAVVCRGIGVVVVGGCIRATRNV